MDNLLDRLSRRRKETILLLDEVQELARSRDNTPLVAALRTSLDTRGGRLQTVFTGSSREGLAAMFSARQAPFFHFATPIELPPLAEPFVDHILETFHRVSRRTLSRGDALAAFERLHANPHFFRVLIEQLLHDPGLAVEPALAAVRERIALDLGYPRDVAGPHRDSARDGAGVGRGRRPALRPAVPPTGRRGDRGSGAVGGRVQAALRRLERAGLADTHTGRWGLVDPEFAAWIREHDGERRRDPNLQS